ncbi:MAG: hypothetical protein IT372_39935 [Polyangiaceae bacterium]|nr:hypothetical protein [Polyangiaceae bacterium]
MAAIDPDALMVALVLAPTTYSRNRFFALYHDPAARRARRRAATLRSVVRHLGGSADAADVAITPAEGGGAVLTYEVPALGLKRRIALEALELAVVRFAVARALGGEAAPPPALRPELSDGPRIDAALARLLPEDPRRSTQAS